MENLLLEARLNRARYGNAWDFGKAPVTMPDYDPEENKVVRYISVARYLSYIAGDIGGIIENNGAINFRYGKNIAISLDGEMNQSRVNTGYPPYFYFDMVDYSNYQWNDVFASSPLIGLQSQKINISSRVVLDECNLLDNIGKIAGGNINKNFPADISIPSATLKTIIDLPCPVPPPALCTEESRSIKIIDIYIPPQDRNPTAATSDFCNYTYQSKIQPHCARIQIILPDGTYPDSILVQDYYWNDGYDFYINVDVIINHPGLTGGLFIITLPQTYEQITLKNNPGITIKNFLLNTVFPLLTSNGIYATQLSSPYCRWYMTWAGLIESCDKLFAPPPV